MSETELSEAEQELKYEKKDYSFQFLIIFSRYEEQLRTCIKNHTQ